MYAVENAVLLKKLFWLVSGQPERPQFSLQGWYIYAFFGDKAMNQPTLPEEQLANGFVAKLRYHPVQVRMLLEQLQLAKNVVDEQSGADPRTLGQVLGLLVSLVREPCRVMKQPGR